MATPATGKVRTILTEHDSTWVEVVDDVVWLDHGKSFTWVSERDGWNHVYAVSRDGKSVRLVTKGAFDVLEVEGIDGKGGWLYYIASPDNPTQKLPLPDPARRQGQAGAALARGTSRAPTATTGRPTTSTPSRPTPRWDPPPSSGSCDFPGIR